MFIQTEPTPNPATLKFLPGRDVLPGTPADFPDAEKASASPLARRLFAIPGVTGVFLGSDFITVTKADRVDWPHIKPAVLGSVMEHFMSGEPVLDAGAGDDSGQGFETDTPVVRQIRELIDTRVRPAVAQDGGDIVFHKFESGIVYLHMRGACAGCPSSTATLRHGIERMLRHYVPEVTEVRPV